MLRVLHQVYEKMLNYISQSVYLPKLVPLKWGCGGVWGVRVCGEFMELVEGKVWGKGRYPTWHNTYQLTLHVPHFLLYGMHKGGGQCGKDRS